MNRVPRWLRWATLLIVVLGATISAVILVRRTSGDYVCLTGTDSQFTTRTVDTVTGKVFTSVLFPLKSYESVAGSWASRDGSKIAFYWISGNYVRLMSTLDLHTIQKRSMTFNVTDNQLIFDGWSADSKYFAVTEMRDNGAEIVTVFDAGTMARVFSKAASNTAWSPQGHQLAYLDAYGGILNNITVTSLDQTTEHSSSIQNTIASDQAQVGGESLLWSSSGRYIALTNNSQVWSYDIARARLQKVTDSAARIVGYQNINGLVRWSLNEDTLFYLESQHDSLMAFDPASGENKMLVALDSDIVTVSPDFKFALLKKGKPGESVQYKILNTETGVETHLTTNGEWILANQVSWYPDLHTVLLWFVDGPFWAKEDGSQPHKINTLTGSYTLFKYGTLIGFIADMDGKHHAGMFDLNTGEYHAFKESNKEYFYVAPAPNGQMVSLSFNRAVKLISADDTQTSTFESADFTLLLSRYLWSPNSAQFAIYTPDWQSSTTLHLLQTDGKEREIPDLPKHFHVDKWTNCDIGH